MTTLFEKLRALAETEKQATAGPWIAIKSYVSWFVKFPTKGKDSSVLNEIDAALIAESRTLLKELLESWFDQNDALKNLTKAATNTPFGKGDLLDPILAARKALNLATTPHPWLFAKN